MNLIIIISILLASAFFSGIEIAFISANRLKIEVDKNQIVVIASASKKQNFELVFIGRKFWFKFSPGGVAKHSSSFKAKIVKHSSSICK